MAKHTPKTTEAVVDAVVLEQHPASQSDKQVIAQAIVDKATADEGDKISLGQRRINLIWEITQATIALTVTGTGMYTAAFLAMRNDPSADSKASAITAFLLISNTVFLVIGFYFGRTNHQKTGGVGDHREIGR